MSLFLGDCLEQMKTLEADSVDAIVTDPPYGLAFMGKKWDYDVPSADVWREALRVLKPGGHLLSFGGARTYHRLVTQIEDAGFEIRDQIQWLYGSGFPKSHNLDGEWEGWGTALKPANEPICLARKPFKGTVASNVLKHDTGALNIDESRIGPPQNRQTKWASNDGHDNAMNKVSQGWDGNYRLESRGRWPANVILDEEAAQMLDEQSGQLHSRPNKNPRKLGDQKWYENKDEDILRPQHDVSGGASRFFYVAKASKRERGEGNAHPTVKPLKLMQYLIKLITPPGGTVLDPFMGSGSTGVAAKALGFKFIGIEMNKEYLEIAEKRIS